MFSVAETSIVNKLRLSWVLSVLGKTDNIFLQKKSMDNAISVVELGKVTIGYPSWEFGEMSFSEVCVRNRTIRMFLLSMIHDFWIPFSYRVC